MRIPKKIKSELNGINGRFDWAEDIKDVKEYIQTFLDLDQPETLYHSGKVQCQSGKSRSFYDIYMMCKDKFPRLKKRYVAKSLIELITDHPSNYRCLRCPDINKVVFFKVTESKKDYWSLLEPGRALARNRICCDSVSYNKIVEEAEKC
jgi:hypothetical protein